MDYLRPPIVLAQGGYIDHTGTTNQTDLVSATVPGGLLGTRGMLELRASISLTNNANNKVCYAMYGGQSFVAINLVSSKGATIFRQLWNVNSASVQAGHPPGDLTASASWGGNDGFAGSVNSATDQVVKLVATLANAADHFIMQGWQVLVWPRA